MFYRRLIPFFDMPASCGICPPQRRSYRQLIKKDAVIPYFEILFQNYKNKYFKHLFFGFVSSRIDVLDILYIDSQMGKSKSIILLLVISDKIAPFKIQTHKEVQGLKNCKLRDPLDRQYLQSSY